MKPNQWLESINPVVNDLWRGSWKAGITEPGRYLRDHELVVVSNGSCQTQIDDSVYRLTPGSFLIVPPGRYHVTTTEGHGVFRHCVHFDWTPATRTRPRRPIWSYHPVRLRRSELRRAPGFVPRRILTGRFEAGSPILAQLETLFHHGKSGEDFDRSVCRPILTQLLLHLLWQRTRHAPRLDRAGHLAYAVKDLLDHPPQEPASIQDLLATLGFSYAHLSRSFKKKFGISPLRYRRAGRLERAKHLLKDPRRTIASVAYETGFQDPAYFSRQFRRSQGLAPRHFR